MKGCLKPMTPVLGSPRTRSPSPSTGHSSTCHRHVVFCPEEPEIHFADEWDRTPTLPARKLSYQEILELKAIQRSLPHANQLPDPHARRPFQNQFLCKVPIGLLPLLSESDHSTSRPPSTPTDEPVPDFSSGYFGVGVQNPFGSSYTERGHHTTTIPPSSATIGSNLPPPFKPPPNPVECWSPDSELWNKSSNNTTPTASTPTASTPTPTASTPAAKSSPRSWAPQRSFPPPPPSFSSSKATPPHLSHLYPPPSRPPRQKPTFAFLTLLDSPNSSQPGTGTNTPGSAFQSPTNAFDSRNSSTSELDSLVLPLPSLNNPDPSPISHLPTPGSAPTSPPLPEATPDVLPIFKRRTPTNDNPPQYFPPFPLAVSLTALTKSSLGKEQPVVEIHQPKPINPRLKAIASPTLAPPSPLTLNTDAEDLTTYSPNLLNSVPKFARNAVASSSRLAPPLPLTGRELRSNDKFAAAKSRARPNPKRTELMMINDELVEIEVDSSDVSDVSDISDVEWDSTKSDSSLATTESSKPERKKKKEYMVINDELVVVELDEYESDEDTPSGLPPDKHDADKDEQDDTALSIPLPSTTNVYKPSTAAVDSNPLPPNCSAYASTYAPREQVGWVGGV